MAGLERAGCCPIALKELNGVVYLANATTPCFEIEPLDAIVRKSGEGPLYPNIIWDLDRLVGMGLLQVSGLVVKPSEAHAAAYSITRAGLAVVRRGRAADVAFDQLASALWSISMSFATAPGSVEADSLLGRDGNYAEPTVARGDVVDFGDWALQNWTKDAVFRIQGRVLERIQGSDPADLTNNVNLAASSPSSAVNLYAQYLSDGMTSNGTADGN